MKNYRISIVLDKRRLKSNKRFPVKLRVFNSQTGKQKLYQTIFDCTEKKFDSTWNTLKPKNEYKDLRLKFQALENTANNVAENLKPFDFSKFERLMYGNTKTEMNVNYYFETIIEKFQNKGSISTAKGYENALQCLLRSAKKENLSFHEITISFLENFENFCITIENKSLTTVSIYTRNIRAVFNVAIAENDSLKGLYPFGKNKYRIKAPKKVKKALTLEQVKTLFEGKPKNPNQEKAKAFWFFSYLCNGMNFKDILNLKYKNIKGDKIEFVRAKTEKTTYDPEPITVYLHPFSKAVLNKYGVKEQSSESNVFPILATAQTPEQRRSKKNAFTRNINQHFAKYAAEYGIEEKVSTNWARHTFSTIAIQKGMSMEFVGEALGHTDIKTTMNYFAGFDNEAKKDIRNKLLDFSK